MILQNDPLFENDNITVTHERHLGLWDLKWEIFIGPDHIVYPIADKLTNPLAMTNALETWHMGQFLQGGKNGRLMSLFF